MSGAMYLHREIKHLGDRIYNEWWLNSACFKCVTEQ
jgi:hypothetical protein